MEYNGGLEKAILRDSELLSEVNDAFCKSHPLLAQKVVTRSATIRYFSHLCKIRHSAHTHNAADLVHTHILINLHGAMLSQIYMQSCGSLPGFPHYPALLHVGYTSMFRLEHFQI